MIEILLNAARLALSDNARKSASALIDFIRHTPDWQKDICSLEAKPTLNTSEVTQLLGGLVVEKMKIHNYSAEIVNAFRLSFQECINNAFEHGCKRNPKKTIQISIDITREYIAFCVFNPPKIKFNLDESLKISEETIRTNPEAKRGRGLMLINQLADEFRAEGQRGVKVVFYRDAIVLSPNKFDGLVLVSVESGVTNSSAVRRFSEFALQNKEDIIFDFTKFGIATTACMTAFIDLTPAFIHTNKKIVVLISIAPAYAIGSLVTLPPSLVAYSLREALIKVGKTNLRKEIMSQKSKRDKFNRCGYCGGFTRDVSLFCGQCGTNLR